MGVVYLGRHVRAKNLRAIKVLPRDRIADESIARFKREAETTSQINHFNVVQIHDVGRSSDVHYIVMEYVQGKTFSELHRHQLLRSKQKHFPWRDALRLIAPLLDALHAVHSRGLIHRDIKPSNVMVRKAGSLRKGVHVILMDFGLVWTLDDPALTSMGAILGTPQYMSPEQALGKPLDARSDVFSVGATLYYMLSGR